MENNNEIMNNNEEVIETDTEEIVKATSNGGMKKATTIGLAMIAGALTYKFVVVPAAVSYTHLTVLDLQRNREEILKRWGRV